MTSKKNGPSTTTQPPVIKNFREFKKTGMITQPTAPVAPKAVIPEIIKAAPVAPPPAVVPPPVVTPLPSEPNSPLRDTAAVLDFLRQAEVVFPPAGSVTALPGGLPHPHVTPVDYSNVPGMHDGVVPGDPNKVIIGGKEYEVNAEVPKAEEPPVPKEEIITSDVVQPYVPVDSNIPTEVIVCIKTPKNFNKDTHPWLQDESLVMLQVVVVDVDGRQSLFLSSLNEDLLYPLEFVYMKGGVFPSRRATIYERIYRDAHKTKEPESVHALEIFDAIVAKNTNDVAVEISLINTEKGPLYKVKLHQVVLNKTIAPNR